jgi:hypothetical protein
MVSLVLRKAMRPFGTKMLYLVCSTVAQDHTNAAKQYVIRHRHQARPPLSIDGYIV